MTHAQYDCDLIAKDKDELIAQQAAVIEQMREALRAMVVCARDEGKGLRIADEALALKPCPEVLNKVRADAVMKFFNRYRKDDFAHIHNTEAEHYAERMAAWMNAAPVVQPGMVMVPREPTVAMREAIESSAVVTFSRTKAIYAAMIAAAEGKK